jgi:membrane associated rhomboid family serine protease
MVTIVLIVLNLVAFAYELRLGAGVDDFIRRWGVVPADVLVGPSAIITLFTSTFLHIGWLHLGSNMVYLGVFGYQLEKRVGAARYAAIYILSGIAGSLAFLLAQPTSHTPAVGASGAIAGVIAAHLVLFLHVVESTPTLLLLLLWLATQLLSGVASSIASTGIAWWAHLGGFGGGFVLAQFMRRQKPRMAR